MTAVIRPNGGGRRPPLQFSHPINFVAALLLFGLPAARPGATNTQPVALVFALRDSPRQTRCIACHCAYKSSGDSGPVRSGRSFTRRSDRSSCRKHVRSVLHWNLHPQTIAFSSQATRLERQGCRSLEHSLLSEQDCP